MVGAKISPVEAVIAVGWGGGGTTVGLAENGGALAAEAIRDCENFRKVVMTAAKMKKASRAHLSGLCFLG